MPQCEKLGTESNRCFGFHQSLKKKKVTCYMKGGQKTVLKLKPKHCLSYNAETNVKQYS